MTHGENTGYTLPGRAESYWLATTLNPTIRSSGDINVDVAIIGEGQSNYFGFSFERSGNLSQLLRQTDNKRSYRLYNSKITSQHNLIYDRLISKFGRAKAKQYAEANQAAPIE